MTKKRAVRMVLTLAVILAAVWWLRGRQGEQGSNHEEAPLARLDEIPAEDLIPGELVVDFRDDESRDAVAALGRQLGVQFHPASSQVDVDEVYTVETGDPEALLSALRANPDVEAADYDVLYGLPEDALAADDEALPTRDIDPSHKDFPNDPKYKYQWHLEQVHAKATWKASQGDGVIVAVIDTGVARVPDLAQTEIVPGYNFVNNTADATDDHGHGTHVAGTIAQSTHNGIGVAGVAFHAKIMPIKVLSARGSGSVSGIAEGIRWAADHGAKVINMSLGGAIASSVLAKAVKYAHDKGVTVVCAAGNDGRGKVSYPAAYPGAIAVAATQYDESTTFYSNWGKEIDVAAPGGNTRVDQNGDGMPDGVLQNTVVPGDTSRNDYLLFMGTSMASPHVAGVAALVVSSGVTDPDAVEKVLKDTARPPKGDKGLLKEGKENRYGAGIVDAQAAVQKAQLGEGTRDLGLALSGLALIGFLLRRRMGRLGVGGLVAMVVSASGLFFLPSLGLPGLHILGQGAPAWDQVLGASAHGNPLFYSALIPIVLVVFGYGFARWRGVLAGIALGFAGHLAAHALFRTTDIRFVPDALDGVWLLANAGLAWLAGLAVLRK